jgi:phosphoribosylformylglycinamidine cyclo-ligase
MNYNDSGVKIDIGNDLVKSIFTKTQNNKSSRILSSIGGYSSFYDISHYPIANPVIVSSTDGVGTKLKLALKFNTLNLIGKDLVAMVVNDIITCGATPLFFLDYYATGELSLETASSIIDGIIDGCNIANISLIGGETAEMPLLYKNGDFDLAGFGIGIINREKIIKPNMVSVGDVIIGINSSGPHSNGYSIINQVFDFDNISNELIVDLLTPTKIYVDVIKELVSELDINGIAHITGGGITENIPRILPEYTTAYISLSSWDIPEVFWNIHEAANITLDELLRVFNCGIGMCIIVDKEDCDRALEIINNNNEVGTIIGNVIKGKNKSSEVLYGNW